MTAASLFLATALLHATVLLALAWLSERRGWLPTRRWRELVWSAALVGGLLTATLQFSLPISPLGGQWAVGTSPTGQVVEPAAIVEEGAGATTTMPPESVPAQAEPVTEAASANASPATGPHLLRISASPALLVSAWLLISIALLLRLGANAWRVRRELEPRRAIVDGPAAEALFRLASRAGMRCPRLSLLHDIPGPMTLPGGEICLPDWSLTELSPEQLEALLAHELSHVRRRDPLRQLAASVIAALFFFHPLVYVARRRLEILAELDCDDWAAQQTGSGRALAQCLGVCAENISTARPRRMAFEFGTAMANHRSTLIDRVQRLLRGQAEIEAESTGEHGMRNIVLVIAALVFTALILPVAGYHAGEAQASNNGIVFNLSFGDGKRSSFALETGDIELRVNAEGEFRTNDAENDIIWLDDDAELDIEAEVEGIEHEFRFEERDGDIEKSWERDGDDQEWGDAARAALAEILPIVLRETAMNADERISRLLDEGGVARVLDEIELIRGDFAAREYISRLVSAAPDMSNDELSALIATTGSIESDFEEREALLAIAEARELDARNAGEVLEAARSIQSDFEMRALLTGIDQRVLAMNGTQEAFLHAAEDIQSDFEMRHALSEALEETDDAGFTAAVFRTASEGIQSDFELRALLASAAGSVGNSDALARAYAEASREIQSDFEQREAIVTFAEDASPGVEGWLAILDAARNIGSDFEAAEALLAIADAMPADPAVRQRFMDVLEGVGSDHEYRRVQEKLGER